LEYFGPYFSLHPEVEPIHKNANSPEYLAGLVEQMHALLKMVAHAPSVQMSDVPAAADAEEWTEENSEKEHEAEL
jgi:hypothetical protein